MGFVPDQVWPMTPRDTALLLKGWNEAQGEGGIVPPTPDEVDELRRMYPDG